MIRSGESPVIVNNLVEEAAVQQYKRPNHAAVDFVARAVESVKAASENQTRTPILGPAVAGVLGMAARTRGRASFRDDLVSNLRRSCASTASPLWMAR